MLNDLLTDFGTNLVSAVAGSLGAAASAFQGKDRTKKERAINFIVGFCTALWIPALIIRWLGLPNSPEFYGALGFMCGYFGMAVADAAVQFDWRAIATSWLTKK